MLPVAMILSFPVIAFPRIPHSLEQLPPFETPRASFIPAQGNALGSWPKEPSGALKARLILAWHEAGRWPATAKGDEPRTLPWAGMKQAVGLKTAGGPRNTESETP